MERVDPRIYVFAQSVKLKDADKKFQVNVQSMPKYELETGKLAAGRVIEDDERDLAIIANQYLELFNFKTADEALDKEIVLHFIKAPDFGLGGASLEKAEEKDYTFKIIGVTEKTVASTEVIISNQDAIDISREIEKDENLYSEDNPGRLVQVKLDNKKYTQEVAQKIKDLGLGAQSPEDILAMLGKIFSVIQAALSIFGIIALVVAAIGIINTLLMAIYERTKEIGVMKAVGANKGHIRWLFLTEAGYIGFIGGIIGTFLGILFGKLLNLISHLTFLKDYTAFDISVFPWWLILGVIAFCTLIAILAGLYPASRAARLNPIQALRYE